MHSHVVCCEPNSEIEIFALCTMYQSVLLYANFVFYLYWGGGGHYMKFESKNTIWENHTKNAIRVSNIVWWFLFFGICQCVSALCCHGLNACYSHCRYMISFVVAVFFVCAIIYLFFLKAYNGIWLLLFALLYI